MKYIELVVLSLALAIPSATAIPVPVPVPAAAPAPSPAAQTFTPPAVPIKGGIGKYLPVVTPLPAPITPIRFNNPFKRDLLDALMRGGPKRSAASTPAKVGVVVKFNDPNA